VFEVITALISSVQTQYIIGYILVRNNTLKTISLYNKVKLSCAQLKTNP